MATPKFRIPFGKSMFNYLLELQKENPDPITAKAIIRATDDDGKRHAPMRINAALHIRRLEKKLPEADRHYTNLRDYNITYWRA